MSDLRTLATDPVMRKRREAISDPIRMRILAALTESEGLTAKELGKRVEVNPNRLYYHLRILEEAGVIGIAETRANGRFAERVYKQIYDGRYTWDAHDPVGLSTYLAAWLEMVRAEAEHVLFEQARELEAGNEPPIVTFNLPSFETTHSEAVRFMKRVDALQQEFRKKAAKRTRGNDTVLKFAWVLYEESPSDNG